MSDLKNHSYEGSRSAGGVERKGRETAQQAGIHFAAALWAKTSEEKASLKEEAYHHGLDKFLLQSDELFSIIR